MIDGAENNPPTLLEHNHFQNAKFYSLTGHLILPEPIVMSKITWEKLRRNNRRWSRPPPRLPRLKNACCGQEVRCQRRKLKAAGVEFIQVDKKPFYDATAPVRKNMARRTPT